MSRSRKTSIELLSDIGSKAYDLQAFTDLEIQAALSVLRSVNAPLFDWLTALLVKGQASASPAATKGT